MLYAQDRWSLLLVFQAMDPAGKDSTIKHVMSGVNPQGCQVFSFKQPSSEELDHDFMWRWVRNLPGRIGIFNRSYYEEVFVVRVHPPANTSCASWLRAPARSTMAVCSDCR
jgi:polyphosphate kinase 2 (PPK2 family)